MNWLEQLMPPALVRALGWTLVHSLWQGAVVALALAGLLLLLRRHSAIVRYNTAAAALVALLILAGVTFGRYYAAARTEHVAETLALKSAARAVENAQPGLHPTTMEATRAALVSAVAVEAAPAPLRLQAWLNYFDHNLPMLVAVWLLGLLAMTLRLLGGVAYVQRLRRYRVQPLSDEWQERLAMLATRAGLRQPVELLESALVHVPVVVGHLRPVVLLPLGTVTGLNQTYLEAILAHELAHVARRDYLMNLVQSVAETLFFYHPAIWFITACLRTERENCCDDAATALIGGNPLTVARALAALAELSVVPATPAQLALSALGPDGSVLSRIKRLVQGRTAPTFTEGFMAACLVLGGMVLLTSAVAMADPKPVDADENEGGALSRLPFLQTLPDTSRKAPAIPAIPEFPAAPDEVAMVPDAPELAELGELEEQKEALNMLQDDDDDKDKKRRKRNKQVVIVQEGTRRSGTVVIEKDKKGRLTDMFVDGRRVEVASADKKAKKGKKDEREVEVIRVGPNGRVWSSNNSNFDFHFNDNFSRNFTIPGPGLNAVQVERIREQARRATEMASRQFGNSRAWIQSGRGLNGRDRELQAKALQGAVRSLESTLQDGTLNEEQRQKISRELANIRRQQDNLRQNLGPEFEMRNEFRGGGDEQELEAANRKLEAEMRRHEAEMRRLEVEMHRNDAEMRRHDSEMRRNDSEMRRADAEKRRREGEETEEALRRELRKDGLIKDEGNFQFSLNPTTLTVNGKKQSSALRDKYLRLVEKQTGRKLTGKNSFVINRQSTNRSNGDMPAPPRPPQAPRPMLPTPPAPPAPAPMAPPAPPAPPRIDSDKIRAELRKDGLLGASEKSFQFQLNDEGMTVNGKKQPEATAEKYRKLLDAPVTPDSKGSKTRRNIQISVSE